MNLVRLPLALINQLRLGAFLNGLETALCVVTNCIENLTLLLEVVIGTWNLVFLFETPRVHARGGPPGKTKSCTYLLLLLLIAANVHKGMLQGALAVVIMVMCV